MRRRRKRETERETENLWGRRGRTRGRKLPPCPSPCDSLVVCSWRETCCIPQTSSVGVLGIVRTCVASVRHRLCSLPVVLSDRERTRVRCCDGVNEHEVRGRIQHGRREAAAEADARMGGPCQECGHPRRATGRGRGWLGGVHGGVLRGEAAQAARRLVPTRE